MTFTDLVNQVSDDTKFSRSSCNEIIRAAFNAIAIELEGHGYVRVPNFGRFDVITRKSRNYSMPKTPGSKGEHVTHRKESWKYPKFTPYEHLKEIVK